MKKVSFADMHCSVAQSLEVIGEWWTLLILRDAFLGVTRFDDFAKRLGIARNVLTARLDTLVDNDVLTRIPYDEARGRYDYRLTDKGRALLPVMTAIRQWGDEWILGEGNEPVVVEHTTCGAHQQGRPHLRPLPRGAHHAHLARQAWAGLPRRRPAAGRRLTPLVASPIARLGSGHRERLTADGDRHDLRRPEPDRRSREVDRSRG